MGYSADLACRGFFANGVIDMRCPVVVCASTRMSCRKMLACEGERRVGKAGSHKAIENAKEPSSAFKVKAQAVTLKQAVSMITLR